METSTQTPNQAHTSRHHHSSNHSQVPPAFSVVGSWKWEILNVFTAVGLLGAIYGILQYYENRRVPDWGTAINLNSLIAALATVLRSLLVIVVAEIIGQAKWRFFAGKRPFTHDGPTQFLIKTNHFDQASRGLVGAARLIPTVLRDLPTLLAILVVISSLGIGASIQQTIQTRVCHFPLRGTSSSLPVSRNITAGLPGTGHAAGTLDIANVRAALTSALAPDNENVDFPVSVECSTGNCTFANAIDGIYSTLGMCSSCAATTSLISSVHWTKSSISKDYVSDTVPDTYEEVPAVNYSLPNGMTIEAVIGGSDYHTTSLLTNTTSTVGSSDIEWAGGLIAPRMKALSQWSFANVTIFTSNWHEDKNGFTDYVAVTCTLYPCLRSYRASVTNGKLKESLVGTSPLAPNVVPLFSTDITAEEIEQIDYPQFNAAIYGTHPGVRFQAVQSPCLVGDTIWKNTNISAVADNQPMLMLHADPTGKRRFILEKIIAPSTCIYSMDIVAWSDLESIMDSHLFNTRCDAGSYSDAGVRHMQLDCGNAFWLAKFYNATGTTAIAITEQIGAFTDRLSNKLRMGLLSQPEAVFGQVHETTVCNAINYQWLLYPTILSCCDQWTACLELSSELEAPGSRVAVEELNYTVLISRGEIRS